MDIGNLLRFLNDDTRFLVRNIEKISYKINNASTAVDFNKSCIQNGLLPKYTYCRKANSTRTTADERKAFLISQLKEKEETLVRLQNESGDLKYRWNNSQVHDELRKSIDERLAILAAKHLSEGKKRVARKLSALYGGPVNLPQKVDQFINLSKTVLTPNQKEFLNLGLNCHFKSKPKPHAKRIELEILLDDIQRLEKNKKVTTSPDLQAEFIRESNTIRGHHRTSLLTPELKEAAKQLRENKDIVIRRADKSSLFVVLDKDDYMDKINAILHDESKFKRITRNPTNNLKNELNRIIRQNNKTVGSIKLPVIEGDHKLGYLYGNVKNHKQNLPLRPIISQIPAVTYTLAKRLNELLSPFTPSAYSLKSSEEFLDLLKGSRPSGIIASLDVESLFTNVPVDATIDMICNKLYRSNDAPFAIAEASLRHLLQACTKEVPFYGPDGNMYNQIDGVAMGSPLGVLFANFYMGTLEEEIFSQHPELKPPIYARYIDDVFINTSNEEEVLKLLQAFKSNSLLNFTHEMEENQKLPFLDVLVHRNSTSFATEVFVKSTNLGFCLNAASECPEKYRRSVINSFVKRAFTHCSTWITVNKELQRISQVLTNNGYSKEEVDEVTRRYMNSYFQEKEKQDPRQEIRLYYKNYMTSAYSSEEKALKKIINTNVKPVDPNSQIKLIIYYKTKRTSSLILKNNCLPPTTTLQDVNLVYQYTCNYGDCSHRPSAYIGSTITTLSRRITAHLQDGAILRHHASNHPNTNFTRKILEDNTVILHKETSKSRLRMTEAVYIHLKKACINIQQLPQSTLPTARRALIG